MTRRDALNQMQFVHRYVIAAAHATLWIAALSLAAFFHLDKRFEPHEALLLSTLVAYCAYLCESGLGAWRYEAAHPLNPGAFGKLKIRRWIALNVLLAVGLSVWFLHVTSQWILVAVIATAGWQKFMDGRIPPRLGENSAKR